MRHYGRLILILLILALVSFDGLTAMDASAKLESVTASTLLVLEPPSNGRQASSSSAAPQAIFPSADTFIKLSEPGTSHDGQGLNVASSGAPAQLSEGVEQVCTPTEIILLKFSVSGSGYNPVTLKLFGAGDAGIVLNVYEASDTEEISGNPWGEGVTWNTKPQIGTTVLAPAPMPTSLAWVSFTSPGTEGISKYINDQRPDNGGDGTASLAIQTTCAGTGDFAGTFEDSENWFGTGNGPLPVILSSFEAVAKGNQIVLTWATASEVDNEGFNLYRSDTEDGEYVKINDTLIPAQGNPSTGASYSFIDENVQRSRTYYYKLEDVDTSGASTFHGPVSATVRGKGR